MKRCQEWLRIWLACSETQWLLLMNPGQSDEWVTLAWLLILVVGPTQSALLTSAEQPIAYSLLWLHDSRISPLSPCSLWLWMALVSVGDLSRNTEVEQEP